MLFWVCHPERKVPSFQSNKSKKLTESRHWNCIQIKYLMTQTRMSIFKSLQHLTQFSRMKKLGSCLMVCFGCNAKSSTRGKHDSKRRKMMSDLQERERSSFSPDPSSRSREEEERIARNLQEEIARIRTMHSKKEFAATETRLKKDSAATRRVNTHGGGRGLDKEKVLKVSWEKTGYGCAAQRLREVFEQLGVVEDVLIKSSKNKGTAPVVMGSKDATVAAIGNVLGHISNPLLVLLLQTASSPVHFGVKVDVESDGPRLNNLVGVGYQAFEESVLDKLKKAAQKQK